MIRRSFRRGLRLGVLGGVGYAVWRVVQSRGSDERQATEPFTPPSPMRPMTPEPAQGPRVTPLRTTAPSWSAPAASPAPVAPAPSAPVASTAPSAPSAPTKSKPASKKTVAKKASPGVAKKATKAAKKPRPSS